MTVVPEPTVTPVEPVGLVPIEPLVPVPEVPLEPVPDVPPVPDVAKPTAGAPNGRTLVWSAAKFAEAVFRDRFRGVL